MKCRGFTLLEAAVALAILAVVLGAAFRAIGAATAGDEEFRLRLVANWVAQDRLALHRARGEWPAPGQRQGNSDEAGHSFVWREEVVPTPNPRFRRIEVSVSAGDSGHVIARQTGFLVHTP